MTPATIIREAQAGGVSLTISPAGTIKATGDIGTISAVFEKRNAEFLELVKHYDLPRDRELFTEHHLGSFIDESDDYRQAIFFTKRGYVDGIQNPRGRK